MADTEKLIKTPENYSALATSEHEGGDDGSQDLHSKK